MRYANGSAGECRQEKARDHVPMTGEVQGLLQRFVESHREGALDFSWCLREFATVLDCTWNFFWRSSGGIDKISANAVFASSGALHDLEVESTPARDTAFTCGNFVLYFDNALRLVLCLEYVINARQCQF